MTTMRAITMAATGGPGVLTIADCEMPTRISAEFLVKVIAAGVNPIDAKTRAGNVVSSEITTFPAVLGQDFSGIVVESPFEAHPIKPGDEVYGMVMVPRFGGSYAQYVTVPSLSLAKKPASISHLEAAAVPVAALTAWGIIVEIAKAHEGQRILIHAGAGGVGHFAVQFARYFGAHVIATGSGRNLAWLSKLGANEVIDYTATRFENMVFNVDVVVDLVGNVHADTGTRSLATLRPGGLIINVPSGSWPTLV
ncbi:MAG: zinc-binding oxidoreductase, partial [Glaciihabitans sp.]|nr:zinc-binding oxidoreductase [Glaciihabitans sp.]